MFGLFVAALCGVGLIRLWNPRRRLHSNRLNRITRRLKANPAQESALRQSAEEIRQAFRNFNPKARLGVLAAALTAETVDRDHLRRQMQEPETGSLSDALVNAVERLRSALDLNQRQQLAAMASGGGRRRCH